MPTGMARVARLPDAEGHSCAATARSLARAALDARIARTACSLAPLCRVERDACIAALLCRHKRRKNRKKGGSSASGGESLAAAAAAAAVSPKRHKSSAPTVAADQQRVPSSTPFQAFKYGTVVAEQDTAKRKKGVTSGKRKAYVDPSTLKTTFEGKGQRNAGLKG